MPRQVFDYDPPERFVAGTVGEPGSRTFFLQARSGPRLTSVALEKQQVAVLAERVDELLDEVLRRSGGTAAVPAVTPAELEDTEPLETPIVEEFRVGTMALEWDGGRDRVVITAQAVVDRDDADRDAGGPAGTGGRGGAGDPAEDVEDEGDDLVPPERPDGPDLLRVHLTGAVARAFARRALSVVSAGRPPCPFCGLPLDPDGHICPRANGYRR